MQHIAWKPRVSFIINSQFWESVIESAKTDDISAEISFLSKIISVCIVLKFLPIAWNRNQRCRIILCKKFRFSRESPFWRDSAFYYERFVGTLGNALSALIQKLDQAEYISQWITHWHKEQCFVSKENTKRMLSQKSAPIRQMIFNMSDSKR